MLRDEFRQGLVLGLDLLLQELNPLLLVLCLVGGHSFAYKAAVPFSKNSFCQR